MGLWREWNLRAGAFSCLALFAFAAVMPDATASASTLSILHSFCSLKKCKDGTVASGLMRDQTGNLFGTTAYGGPHHGQGTVFELVHGRKYKFVHGFCPSHDCSGGSSPVGPLIIDAAGNLYGETVYGGALGAGIVFELSPGADGWSFRVLYSFCSQGGAGCTDGANPVGGLTYTGAATGAPYDGASPLYGTTAQTSIQAVAFQLVPGETGWSETVLSPLPGTGSGLTSDSTGNLFGTTFDGGSSGYGTAYQLSLKGGVWNQTILYNFCSQAECTDGAYPAAPMVQDSSGNLYGTTEEGGLACSNAGLQGLSCGVIFKLVPNGNASQETILYQFCSQDDCKDGAIPDGGLLIDNSGNLFGTTVHGGGNDNQQGNAGAGVVFEFTGSRLNVLYSFCAGGGLCADGWAPAGTLVTDGAGTLFGTTVFGGGVGEGEVFKLKP